MVAFRSASRIAPRLGRGFSSTSARPSSLYAQTINNLLINKDSKVGEPQTVSGFFG
jgi:hypothetical protein